MTPVAGSIQPGEHFSVGTVGRHEIGRHMSTKIIRTNIILRI